jgi:hypothetical protein
MKCLLQNCKRRRWVTLCNVELQIQHCFKFDLQNFIQITIMGEGLKSHCGLQHAQGVTPRSG